MNSAPDDVVTKVWKPRPWPSSWNTTGSNGMVPAGNGSVTLFVVYDQPVVPVRQVPLSMSLLNCELISSEPAAVPLRSEPASEFASDTLYEWPVRGALAKSRNAASAPAEPSTRVHVFVNRDGISPAARAADPHYVTTLSFFGAGHGDHRAQHHGHQGRHAAPPAPATTCVSVDLTPALSRIRSTRQFRTDKIVVQLLPICRYGSAATSVVRPRRVEIAIL